LLLPAFALAAQVAHAAPAERAPSFSYTLQPRTVRSGGDLHLHLVFTWMGAREDFRFLIPPLELENLNLRDSAEANETALLADGTRVTRTFEYRLAAGARGPARIRGLSLAALDRAGEKHPFDFPEQSFIIRGKPFPWALAAAWAGAIFAAAAAAWGGRRLARRRREQPSEAPRPGEAAVQALNELAPQIAALAAGEALRRLEHIARCYERGAAGELDAAERKRLAKVRQDLMALAYAGVAIEPSRVRALEQEVRQLIVSKQVIAPQR